MDTVEAVAEDVRDGVEEDSHMVGAVQEVADTEPKAGALPVERIVLTDVSDVEQEDRCRSQMSCYEYTHSGHDTACLEAFCKDSLAVVEMLRLSLSHL